ncbi:MAG: tRNA pseudouridine(38-40) synthase TruA [Clostridia bacterium]|nr:tRNA pseudouridine(38-40) synthase TruA [Clostridia bacterium]
MRYLLTIRYIGTAYHGWQVQENALAIQPIIQDALQEMFPHRPGVTGCSRTDSGVHANMYCCHFDSPLERDPFGIICSVNRNLPNDIAATHCRVVDEEFHARYSVTAKEYVYRIYNGVHRDPFAHQLAYHYRFPLHHEAMHQAAQHFVGTYDFSSFCANNAKPGDRTRQVFAASVERDGDYVVFRVSANGFLYNMVRIMVGTLLRVSEGKFTPDQIPEIIAARCRDRAGPTAPPQGLYLNQVFYEEV